MMTPEAIQNIIKQLREKNKQALAQDDYDLSDLMADAMRALKGWDGQQAMPFADELRQWGIALPGDAVSDAPPVIQPAVEPDEPLFDEAMTIGEPTADTQPHDEPQFEEAVTLEESTADILPDDGPLSDEAVLTEEPAADTLPDEAADEAADELPSAGEVRPSYLDNFFDLRPDEPEQDMPNETPLEVTDKVATMPAEIEIYEENFPAASVEPSPATTAEEYYQAEDEPPATATVAQPSAAMAEPPPAEPEPPPAEPEPPPAEPEPPVWDPDDDLQEAFDTAQAYLNNRRYRAALDTFDDLRRRATGRLDEPSEAGYELAAARLADQLQPHVERAQRHTAKQAEDYRGQRQLWGRVLEIDPKDETANRALRELDEREAAREIDRQVSDVRNRLDKAVATNQYPTIVGLLGEAEGLASGNRLSDRQRELDELVTAVKIGRQQVRDYLGLASTKAASEENKEAYAQARAYLDQNAPVAFDERGVFGPVGQEYDPVDFLRLARNNFIDWTRKKALDRKAEAANEAPAAPEGALRTLAEAQAFLTDDALSRDDKDILAVTLREIEKDIAEVNARLIPFRAAKATINKAQMAEPRERLQLLEEARASYPDFPGIDDRIGRARDDVASVVAGELQTRMVAVRQHWAGEEFDEALSALAAARDDAIKLVPDYSDKSKLAEQLAAVKTLEQEIIDAQAAHKRLFKVLGEVDGLLNERKVEDARAKLKELNGDEQRHPETQRRYAKIGDLQDVSVSWQQGREAYAAARWGEAVSLLDKAANSSLQEQKQAALLLNRARAAQNVELALEDEKKEQWKEALPKLRVALAIFENNKTSDHYDPAEALQRRAEDKRKELDEIDANDALLQGVIEQATGLLKTAEQRVEARKSSEAHIEPIGLFAAAAAVLRSALDKNMRSNKVNELETQLYRVRTFWRNTYLEGMRVALKSGHDEYLRKAIALGRTLEGNGLLTDADDKNVYRRVQEAVLDQEYMHLTTPGRVPRADTLQAQQADLERQLMALTDEEKRDPERVVWLQGEINRLKHNIGLLGQEPIHATAIIAENRRERWRIAEDDRETLEKQYLSAVRERVRQQLAVKRLEGAKPALDFLAREIEVDTPELYDDEDFFAELLELCWQAGDWNQANRRAASLASRAKVEDAELKSDLWRGLVAMAHYLSVNNKGLFDAEWSTLMSKARGRKDLDALLKNQRQRQIDWHVRELLERAEKGAAGTRPDEWLDALLAYDEAAGWASGGEAYDEAAGLASGGQKISAGLTALGARLDEYLNTLIPAAQGLNLAGALDDNLRTGQEQLKSLTTIYGRARLLGLKPVRKDEVEQAITVLKKKLEPGLKVQVSLDQGQKKIEEALLNPQPFQADGGGWSFEEADDLLAQAQFNAKGDKALQGHVRERVDRLEELKERGGKLNDLVREFRQAVAQEDFASVEDTATRLEQEWNIRKQADGFRGLERLIKVSYPLDKRVPRSLSEFSKVATSQQLNYADWQEWAKPCEAAYSSLEELAKGQARPLTSQLQSKPLATIIADCDDVQKRYGAFDNKLAHRPDKPPMTKKAEQEKNKIDKTKITAAEEYNRRAIELKKEAQDKLRTLEDGPLHQLRGAITQLERARDRVGTRPGPFQPIIERIPPQLFKTAKIYLDQGNDIDPYNVQLAQLRIQYEAIKKGRGGLQE